MIRSDKRLPNTHRWFGWLVAFALVLLVPDEVGAQAGRRRRRLTAADTSQAIGSEARPGPGSITLEAFYTGEASSNLSGGIERGTAWRGVADLMLTVDPTPLLGGSGTRIGLDVIGIHGDPPGGLTGDYQGVSNIAAPRTLRLYELWLQQRMFQDRISVLLGIYDVNSVFDVLETAALFMNSSNGMGPEFSYSGRNGAPTYPYPALSLMVRTNLSENLGLSAIVADGVPGDPGDSERTSYRIGNGEGVLIGTELGWVSGREGLGLLGPLAPRWQARRRRAYGSHGRGGLTGPGGPAGRGGSGGRPLAPAVRSGASSTRYGKVALGLWRYTSTFTVPADGGGTGESLIRRGSWGGYLLAERSLAFGRDDAQRMLSGHLRLGAADSRVEEVDRYAGCGIVATRSLGSPGDWQFGLALSAARLSDTYAELIGGGEKRWELAVEITTRIQVTRWFALQPDLQYIIGPGFDPGRPDALVAGLRLGLNG